MMACLPAKFEVDGDGRKAAWRALFLQRVQGLVAQVCEKEDAPGCAIRAVAGIDGARGRGLRVSNHR